MLVESTEIVPISCRSSSEALAFTAANIAA
jgi:hypothetical protein